MSDIRVSVQWKDSTVFAGDSIECTITFKNVAHPRSLRPFPSSITNSPRQGSSRERWMETLPTRPVHGAAAISGNMMSPSIPGLPRSDNSSHRPAQSLSTSNGFALTRMSKFSKAANRAPSLENNKHRRSVSIVSLGKDTISQTSSPSPILSSGRPIRGHARAASLQVMPSRACSFSDGSSSVAGHDSTLTVPSPPFRSSISFVEQRRGTQAAHRTRQQTGSQFDPTSFRQNRNSLANFIFPQRSDLLDKAPEESSSPLNERPPEPCRRTVSPEPHESADGFERLSLPTRILSPASINDTPRSSGELYSMSNNSTETLASECITQKNSRLTHRPMHSRQGSYRAPTKTLVPEVLMMGYAQIAGSFTLDGSLVNQTLFEDAKKKGIIGSQGGGGLVRSKTTKRDSGLLGSFGWANIGESLGELLGSNEFSSLRETEASPNERSIPVLSTPQSILFVDLRLGPGESKSYSYRHLLPKGIPPSHKGRALKVAYNLVVGTQRAARATQQLQVQHADIPFRVLTSVNDQGEILGHDLMSPHIILSDIASISSVEKLHDLGPRPKAGPTIRKSSSLCPGFLSYVGRLLERPHQTSGIGLLSPTEPDNRRLTPMSEGSGTMKDVIDLAILRSNAATSSKRSANRFEIARCGERVAVIMLARPAYRLGETIPIAVDFEGSDLQCYSLHAILENFETIDPAIALRSKASVYRVTRRTHASQCEPTTGAKKVLFNPTIPLIATPDFITSGITLQWRLRFEFVTSRIDDTAKGNEGTDDLLEEVASDERAIVKAAVQGLTCESFDVSVPLRVYGATAGFDEKTEVGELRI